MSSRTLTQSRKKSLIVKKPKNHSFGLCDVCSREEEEGGRGLQFTAREGVIEREASLDRML